MLSISRLIKAVQPSPALLLRLHACSTCQSCILFAAILYRTQLRPSKLCCFFSPYLASPAPGLPRPRPMFGLLPRRPHMQLACSVKTGGPTLPNYCQNNTGTSSVGNLACTGCPTPPTCRTASPLLPALLPFTLSILHHAVFNCCCTAVNHHGNFALGHVVVTC